MNVSPYLDSLMAYIEAADYAGYDPYDALNSPFIRFATARSKWLRIAATQALRRSPINLRPLLGIRKGHNPKGIGLFLWGYTKLYALEKNERHLSKIDYLLDLLDKLKSKGYSGNCWGYNFDWQSRTLYAPRFTPTIVNSAFIGHALLDTYASTGKTRALDMAVPIKDFIVNDLNRLKDGATFCFSYTPLDDYAVHNANLLGASLLARITQATDDQSLLDPALTALDYSMKYQKADGSWWYSERPGYNWIDSFHTGFNLQAIRYILKAGLASQHEEAYHKGVEYYAGNFFLPDGTPKYYHDRVYPIDIHAPAQAICYFSHEGEKHRDLTDRVLHWILRHMYNNRGYFYFRKGKFLTNRTPYIRWSQAWAFHALTEYLSATSEAEFSQPLQ